MEVSQTEELENLIERLVTTGSLTLDEASIKRVKSLCKHNASCLEHTFNLLMVQLQKEHSEIRYSAFQIVNELFVRSHLFRTLLLEKFQEFMEWTLETDFDSPLPPPKAAADRLKASSLKAIRDWYNKYGIAYHKLSLAYDFLKDVKKVKFDMPEPSIHNLANEQYLSRKNIVNGVKLDNLKKEVEGCIWEIKYCIVEIENCLKLIIPVFHDNKGDKNAFDTVNTDSIAKSESFQNGNENSRTSNLREIGLPDTGYSVELDISEISSVNVSESKDNKALLDRIRDLAKSAYRIHLPRLRSWLGAAGKCGAPSNFIKELIDLKTDLQTLLDKCNEMKVSNITESDDDDCDDFIEVPEQALSRIPQKVKPPHVPNNSKTGARFTRENTDIWTPLRHDEDVSDPTSYKYALAQQAKLQAGNKEALTKETKLKKVFLSPRGVHKPPNENISLKQKAPFVTFGKDLLAWDKEKYKELKDTLTLSAAKELDVGHRFYGGSSASLPDSGVSEAALSSITSRIIEFSGDFQPVTRSCRAPLDNGKLCSRQDRFNCPFHGKIIDRDACGNPVSVHDQPSTSKPTSTSDAWNNSAFLNDLEQNLGGSVHLFRKKKRKKPENGLTDLKKMKNTSRSRLQKKVLKQKTLKHVAETLNNLDARRNLDKFGDNFNYALN